MANNTIEKVKAILPVTNPLNDDYGLVVIKKVVEQTDEGEIIEARAERLSIQFAPDAVFALGKADDEKIKEITRDLIGKYFPDEPNDLIMDLVGEFAPSIDGSCNIRAEIRAALRFLRCVLEGKPDETE